jgi:hypothetical protein
VPVGDELRLAAGALQRHDATARDGGRDRGTWSRRTTCRHRSSPAAADDDGAGPGQRAEVVRRADAERAGPDLIRSGAGEHFVAGPAGAAYLSGGGLGGWEFPFVAVMTYVAYRGLESWTYLGIGWLLHTAWDILHHLRGHPIIPFVHGSSLGCAICDPVIAIWCLTGGRSVTDAIRSRLATGRTG